MPDLDRENVARSLTKAINLPGIDEGGSCHDVAPGRWRCDVPDPGGSTAARYAVRATSGHCWTARLLERADRAPDRAKGCVRSWPLSEVP